MNKPPASIIYLPVRWFRNIWFALAALLWLPAYAHCQLETLTGLEILQCTVAAPDSQAPAKDCDDCCAVEKSHYRADHSRLTIPTPELISPLQVLLLAPPQSELSQPTLDQTSAPPDLPQRWHFLARTALPVRAPSFVS